MRLAAVLPFLLPVCAVFAVDAGVDSDYIVERDLGHDGIHRRDICMNEHVLGKRATPGDVGVGVGVGANVSLPSVGLSLGNITTKVGNINLTVTNVTIAVGNIEVQDISIGNITVIVSVPLPGASPVHAFSALNPGSSISGSSSAAPTSTASGPTSVTQPATTSTGSPATRRAMFRRQDDDGTTAATTTTSTIDLSTLPAASSTDTSIGVGATGSVDVTGNPISLDTGNVFTEIGNVSILVGHVNVSVGDVTIKNVDVGNIFVFVQIGQPDVAGIVNNATNNLLDATR